MMAMLTIRSSKERERKNAAEAAASSIAYTRSMVADGRVQPAPRRAPATEGVGRLDTAEPGVVNPREK